MQLRARFARWRHSLVCMWRGGLMFTGYDRDGRVSVLGCTCGRVFYERPH